jgi:hypothetical protein
MVAHQSPLMLLSFMAKATDAKNLKDCIAHAAFAFKVFGASEDFTWCDFSFYGLQSI